MISHYFPSLLSNNKFALVPCEKLFRCLNRFESWSFDQLGKIFPPEAIWVDLTKADKEGMESVKLFEGEIEFQVLRDCMVHEEEDIGVPSPLMELHRLLVRDIGLSQILIDDIV